MAASSERISCWSTACSLLAQSLLDMSIDAIGGEIDRVQVLVSSFVETLLERKILVLEI